MEQYRAEYMVDGTNWLPSENDFSTRELGLFMPKDGSFSNRNESQKERLRFVPAPMVGLGRPVSRVEMNAKNSALDTVLPKQCYPMLFLRPKARKRALTKPTLSYMGHAL
jgi:hypothetical protein